MRRIPVSVLLAPATIYQHAARTAEGYAPLALSGRTARFAVVKNGDTWSLVHRRSGMACNAAIPAYLRKLTMTDKLAVAYAWEAADHLDWSAFDGLAECTPETIGPAAFGKLTKSQQATITELRSLAAQALEDK